MRGGAGFEPDQTRRQTAKEVEDLRAAQCAPYHDAAVPIDAVDLEH
jgi:hypothetical protein